MVVLWFSVFLMLVCVLSSWLLCVRCSISRVCGICCLLCVRVLCSSLWCFDCRVLCSRPLICVFRCLGLSMFFYCLFFVFGSGLLILSFVLSFWLLFSWLAISVYYVFVIFVLVLCFSFV
jgi:hypothetical protein